MGTTGGQKPKFSQKMTPKIDIWLKILAPLNNTLILHLQDQLQNSWGEPYKWAPLGVKNPNFDRK